MDIYYITIFFLLILLALAFGSFANVLIYRVPESLPLTLSRSFCPSCGYQIPWHENIPILSYFMLNKRCASCDTKIPIQYPLVEIAVLLIAIPFIYKFSSLGDYLFVLMIVSLLVSLAVIDHKYHLLPHKLTYIGIIITVIYYTAFGPVFSNILDSFYSETHNAFEHSLAGFASAMVALGAALFCFDCLVHFANKFRFKEKAERITSSALTLRLEFLEENIDWVYAILAAVSIFLISTGRNGYLEHLYLFIGVSYFLSEILMDGIFGKGTDLPDPETEAPSRYQTLLGGGDIMLLGMISVLFDFKEMLICFQTACAMVLIYLLVKTVYASLKKGELVFVKLSDHVPLGGALALATLTVMMIL